MSEPVFEREGRAYHARGDDEPDVPGSELLHSLDWDELPPRRTLRARLRTALGAEDDEVALRLVIDGTTVATLDVFLTEEGLELGGFARGDVEALIVVDLAHALGLTRNQGAPEVA
jgi:hypothetical protein